MAPVGRQRERGIKRSSATKVSKRNSTKTKRNRISRKPPEHEEVEVWNLGMIRFRLMAYQRSSEQEICVICGVDDDDHIEHYCPFNYIYGRSLDDTCRGDCPVGEHRIISRDHRKFLRRFVRVSNLPLGFQVWELENLCKPFGPLLMWDVPRLRNDICGCKTDVLLTFGGVVFKRREDAERAIHELNGYEAGGRKLRVDWVYPSCA